MQSINTNSASAAGLRQLHTTITRLEKQQETPQSVSEAHVKDSTPSTSAAIDAEASIPWYLRVTTPTPINPQSLPNPALQDLPPLPSNPPAILQSLLTHLSISIGLDALTLLDLRGLSPPSALGANLIMILGTARSEKHLNTSADRFCRWVRSTYKLRPYADGLLGRNELKLKMRRRNKKLKLAQSVGNMMFEEGKGYDDGITTGWICCNLGSVDGAVVEEAEATSISEEQGGNMNAAAEQYQILSQKDQERPLEDEDEYKNPSDEEFTYRGFGDSSTAPKIVVQMFTEEKRLEMDLEGLWEARIRRRIEKQNKEDQPFETSLIEEEIETPGVTPLRGDAGAMSDAGGHEREYRPMHERMST